MRASSMVMVDVDDTIIEVHDYAKQGSGYAYSRVRSLNALIGTVTGEGVAPVIMGSRMRKGNTGSPRGAKRFGADVLATLKHTILTGRKVIVRADSAFYGYATISAALTAGADVSVTVRMDKAVKRAIAEIEYTAFTSRKKSEHVTGRLVVRRIPD